MSIENKRKLLNCVQLFNHLGKKFKAFRQTFRVLDAEVTAVMTVVVATIVEEHGLTAVRLNLLHQQRAVFTTRATVDIKDALNRGHALCNLFKGIAKFFIAYDIRGLTDDINLVLYTVTFC